MDNMLQKANSVAEEVVAIRRDIHAHPELGHKEFRTSALIREKLEEFGVDEVQSPTETSVVAVIKGRKGKEPLDQKHYLHEIVRYSKHR